MLKRSILAVAIASAAAGAVAQDTINADYPGFDSGSPANQNFKPLNPNVPPRPQPHPGTGGSGDHGSVDGGNVPPRPQPHPGTGDSGDHGSVDGDNVPPRPQPHPGTGDSGDHGSVDGDNVPPRPQPHPGTGDSGDHGDNPGDSLPTPPQGDVGGSGDHGNNPGDSLPTPPQGNVGGAGDHGDNPGDSLPTPPQGDVGGSGDHGNNPGDSLPTPPQGNVGGSGSLGGSAGDVGEGGSNGNVGGNNGTEASSPAANSAIASVSSAQANLRNTNNQVSSRLGSVRSGIAAGDGAAVTGVWGQVNFSDAELKNTGKMEGFDSDTVTLTVGLDREFGSDWVVGGAFTYTKTDTKNHSGTETKTDGYTGTLYAGYTLENWTVDTTFNFGYGSNEIRDDRIATNNKDDFNSWQTGLRSVAGYEFASGDSYIKPLAGLSYTHLKLKEYGLGTTTRVDAQNFETMEIGAGIELGHTFTLNKAALEPSVQVMVWHDFRDDSSEISYRFLDTGIAGRASGEDLGSTVTEVRAAVDYVMDNGLTASAGYNYATQSNFKADSYTIKLRYDF